MALRGFLASAVLLLAALLRLSGLDRTGLDTSELAAVAAARVPAAELLPRLHQMPAAAPLPYVVLRQALEHGLREPLARLPFALAGVVAVGAAMLLLRDLFGGRVALCAGLVLAAAPLAVAVSRSAAPAALAAAAATLWAWLSWRVLRHGRGVWWCIGSGAAALLAGYGALAIATASASIAAAGWATGSVAAANARRTLLAVGGALILFAPWALYDLPTEPGAEFVLRLNPWALLGSLPRRILFGSGAVGAAPHAVAWAVAALAALGLVAALRRAHLAGLYAAAIVVLALGGTLAAARLAPHSFSPAQLLFVLPLYLGFAAFGLETLLRLIPSPRLWTPACLATAAAVVALVEWPVVAAHSAAPAAQDWRGSFAVVRANLGRDDRVAVPLAGDAVDFYGRELRRRLPHDPRPASAAHWLQASEPSWLVVDRRAPLHEQWPELQKLLAQRFRVDLSPSAEPQVLYLDPIRQSAWMIACHFELPAQVVARGTLLRDCLREIGPVEGPLRQAATVARSDGVSLRNPSLLEAVSALVQAGRVDEARALADAIVRREPDWAEASRVQPR